MTTKRIKMLKGFMTALYLHYKKASVYKSIIVLFMVVSVFQLFNCDIRRNRSMAVLTGVL